MSLLSLLQNPASLTHGGIHDASVQARLCSITVLTQTCHAPCRLVFLVPAAMSLLFLLPIPACCALYTHEHVICMMFNVPMPLPPCFPCAYLQVYCNIQNLTAAAEGTAPPPNTPPLLLPLYTCSIVSADTNQSWIPSSGTITPDTPTNASAIVYYNELATLMLNTGRHVVVFCVCVCVCLGRLGRRGQPDWTCLCSLCSLRLLPCWLTMAADNASQHMLLIVLLILLLIVLPAVHVLQVMTRSSTCCRGVRTGASATSP